MGFLFLILSKSGGREKYYKLVRALMHRCEYFSNHHVIEIPDTCPNIRVRLEKILLFILLPELLVSTEICLQLSLNVF